MNFSQLKFSRSDKTKWPTGSTYKPCQKFMIRAQVSEISEVPAGCSGNDHAQHTD